MTEFVFQGDPGLGGSGGRAEGMRAEAQRLGPRREKELSKAGDDGPGRRAVMFLMENKYALCLGVFLIPEGALYRCRTWLEFRAEAGGHDWKEVPCPLSWAPRPACSPGG